jgi:hypothetical protein
MEPVIGHTQRPRWSCLLPIIALPSSFEAVMRGRAHCVRVSIA